MKFLTFLVLLIFLLAYAIVGGLILRAIETNYESDLKSRINSTIYKILETKQCLNTSDIVLLEDIVDDMDGSGVFLLRNGTVFFRSRFDIRSSILIACGLFAGFGIRNGVPVTLGGKIFTAFYGLFIGFYHFFVICIIGDLLDILLQFVYLKMMKRYNKGRTVSCFYHFRQMILSIVGFIFFIAIPAAIVQSIEYWSYGESLFFCLVYVNTIGFGDYSPGSGEVRGQSEDFIQWYRMFVGFWLLIAIMWFATIIYQFNHELTSFAWRTTEEIIDEGMEQVNESINKNKMRISMRRLAPLRPLPPLPPFPSSSSSPPPTSSSSSSLNSSATANTFVVDQTFPALPSFLGQESSGDVSVIKF